MDQGSAGQDSNNELELSLGNKFDTVVHYGDTTIEMHPGGDVTVRTKGKATVYAAGVDAYTNGAVQLHAGANDDSSKAPISAPATSKPGDRMPDGTIYAGVSPDTGKPMYTTTADAPLTYTFNEAQDYAAKLDAHGHDDWRVPILDELNLLFNNRAAIGGFNETGAGSGGWYWSGSQCDFSDGVFAQRFGDGVPVYVSPSGSLSLRCVRG